jgi:hypothetical protein
MRLRLFHWFVLAWLPVSISWAQEVPQTQYVATPVAGNSALPDAPIAKTTAQDEKPPRIFWIIPTYKVTESKTPTALTPHQKLRIVLNDLTDPYTIGYTGLMAGIAQANNDFPSYGQGAAGYWKRYGAAYADQATAGFFGGFLIPSLLHQDPRYYRMGSGPIHKRFAHSLIRPLITHNDGDGKAFNWSGLLGSLASSGLANTYYPSEERGVGKTFSRWGMGIPYSVIDHLVDEFGPDLERKFFGKKRPSEP